MEVFLNKETRATTSFYKQAVLIFHILMLAMMILRQIKESNTIRRHLSQKRHPLSIRQTIAIKFLAGVARNIIKQSNLLLRFIKPQSKSISHNILCNSHTLISLSCPLSNQGGLKQTLSHLFKPWKLRVMITTLVSSH